MRPKSLPQVGGRYNAMVVDKGQGFDRRWLDPLYVMLTETDHRRAVRVPRSEQAYYREAVVDQLGLPACYLEVNCRNTPTDSRVAARHLPVLVGIGTARAGAGGRGDHRCARRETLESLRAVLHGCRLGGRVPPWQTACFWPGSHHKGPAITAPDVRRPPTWLESWTNLVDNSLRNSVLGGDNGPGGALPSTVHVF